jgi:hypothetical protein
MKTKCFNIMLASFLFAALAVNCSWAAPVTGPGTIDWKGLTWTVDANAQAEVVDGNLYIEVNGETADPAFDNWNVHANLPTLDYTGGAWFKFAFLDSSFDSLGGGPRAYLDTWEGETEYMYQGGILPDYASYFTNYALFSGTWGPSSFFGAGDRATGEHSFTVEMTADNEVNLYFDNILRGTIASAETPSYFETAFLGITSDSWTTGSFGSGTYTDFAYGTGSAPVPVPAAVWLLGSGLMGLIGVRRKMRK